jgi:hypothetical protein
MVENGKVDEKLSDVSSIVLNCSLQTQYKDFRSLRNSIAIPTILCHNIKIHSVTTTATAIQKRIVMYKNILTVYLARINFSIPYSFLSKFGGSLASQCLFDFTLPISA